MKILGHSFPRVDAYGKVTGSALYSGDLSMEGMLHMKILFSGRPHARVIRINTELAEQLQGVRGIFTARDVPVNEYGLQKKDQPVLCGPGSQPVSSGMQGDVVRFSGDQVAAIVADTEEIATRARDLIQVEYENLPAVFDPISALKPNAPIIHPELGDSNICVHDRIRKGDVESSFLKADVIVESEYHTPYQEHAYLQPEAGLAYFDEEGRLTIQCAGQWTHADREAIAHSLGCPADQVRVIYPAIGGAFGGREDISVQIVLALASWKLKKPVKIIWSREESIIGHGKRHPMTLKTKWGASRDGKLLAVESTIIADAGAYMYTTNKVLGNCTITATGPYFVPHVKEDVYGVYTNNIPTAAFRGFGAPQALFMAESQMNKLAEKLGMDPVEIRHLNALREGNTLNVGTPAPGKVSIVECIEAARDKFGWKAKIAQTRPVDMEGTRTIRKGIGFACGFKNVGFSFGYQENSWAKVEIHGKNQIENVILWHAGAEVGQGFLTAMTQFAAETINVPYDRVTMVTSDSARMGNPGSASASRLTFMAGNAVKGAAEAALAKWNAEERPAIAEYTYLAPKTSPFDKETGHSTPNLSYAYTAQGVEIELDMETGILKILRVVSANDVGQVVNQQSVEGQVEGGVVQAAGYTITENFISQNGQILTNQFSKYLIPTVLDIPETVDSVIVEVAEPNGPYGARGLGELPFLPIAPAIVAAVHDATGVWFNEFPLTPEEILRGLGKI